MARNCVDIEITELENILARIGDALGKPASLLLIGSAVGIHMGQPGRFTADIDVWLDGSDFDRADLAQACARAGIAFDPKGHDTDGAYLQIVGKGIVDIGRFESERKLFRTGNLTVSTPPIENIAASKLLRASEKDVEDILFLLSATNTPLDAVSRAIDTLDERHRETARGNLVLVELLMEDGQCPR